MAEYIDKEAAMLAAMDYEGRGNAQDASMDIASAIWDIPAADVRENVKAKWIPVTNGRGGSECSKCHAYAPSYQSGAEYTSPFCPNCGAQMGGIVMSNADALRAMSDDEMAEGILDRICPPDRFCGDYVCESFKTFPPCWLDWLKSPAEVEK